MKAILFIAALMAGLSLVLFNLARLISGQPSTPQVLLLIVPAFLAGSALGAALGLRWSRSEWPAAVWGGLLSAALVLIYLWFFGGQYSPGMSDGVPGDYPGINWDQIRSLLVYLVIVTAGIFFLPLFDPYVRRRGPAPARWKVALAALGLLLVAAPVDIFLAGSGDFGLVSLVVGGSAALLLAGLGLLLSAARLLVVGAWAGGLGVLSWIFVLLLWTAAGFPWFP